MQFYSVLALLLVLTSSISTYAGKDRSYVSFTASLKNNDNISNEPVSEPKKYAGNQELNLSFFMRPGWLMQLIYGKSTDSNYSFSGAGLRIQTPGYFLFKYNAEGSFFKRRRSPIDTSLHAELLRMNDQTETNISTGYYISRAGFTLTWVPMKSSLFHVELDISTLLVRSDLLINSGIGLGIEF